MFTLVLILAAAYIILKVVNTNARLRERDAQRAAEEEARQAEEEAYAEDELTRAEAVDVDPDVIGDTEDADDVDFAVESEEAPEEKEEEK